MANKNAASSQTGKPAVLTSRLIRDISNWVKEDVPFEIACRAAGVSPTAGENWLRRGRAEATRLEQGETPDTGETRYLEFFLTLDRIEARAEAEDIRTIREGGQEWRSRAWLRERKEPRRWGRPARPETELPEGQPVQLVMRMADG